MSKVEVKLDDKAMEELLRSPPVLADLKRRADRIAAVCGFGYKAYAEQGASPGPRVGGGRDPRCPPR